MSYRRCFLLFLLLICHVCMGDPAESDPEKIIHRCEEAIKLNMTDEIARGAVISLIEEIKTYNKGESLKSPLYKDIAIYYEVLLVKLGKYFHEKKEYEKAIKYYREADKYSISGYGKEITVISHNLKYLSKQLNLEEMNRHGYGETIFKGHKMVYIPELKALVDKYEVSYSQYKKLMKDNRKTSGIKLVRELTDEHPAVVSFEEAEAYCKKKGFRLLTETEWEISAGKETGNIYSWGTENVDADREYRANYRSFKDGAPNIAVAESYQDYASPYGIVNLSGNVWEWVQGEGGKGKLCKGGGFLSKEEKLSIESVSKHETVVGFRCIKDVKK